MDLFTPAPPENSTPFRLWPGPPLGLVTPAAVVLGCGSPGLVSGSLTRQGTQGRAEAALGPRDHPAWGLVLGEVFGMKSSFFLAT